LLEGPSGLADVGAVLQVLGIGVPGWDHHYLSWVTEQVLLLEQRLQLSQQLFLLRDQLPAVDQKLIDGLRQALQLIQTRHGWVVEPADRVRLLASGVRGMGAIASAGSQMLKMPANLVPPDLPGAVFVSNHSEKLPEIRMSGTLAACLLRTWP
jgi:hypothetical protein